MTDHWKVLLLIIKIIIIKSKFTFADLRNENNKGVAHKCSRKHKCVLKVNLKPNDLKPNKMCDEML